MTVSETSELQSWSDLGGRWPSLLLGNGFSINVWSRFAYQKLFELASGSDIQHPLTVASQELFARLITDNFETVLQLLIHARIADEVLGGGSVTVLDAAYEDIRTSLIESVRYAHVSFDLTLSETLCERLRDYRRVFTTNYDLILYWAVVQDTSAFVDFFWKDGCRFDPSDIEVRYARRPVHYLHGALHIQQDRARQSEKITADAGTILDQLDSLFTRRSRPLFVTEGWSEEKMDQINSSPYLRFAYGALREDAEPVVVLGHSLDGDYDGHVVEALANDARGHRKDNRRVAVGVWPRLDERDILHFKNRVRHSLQGLDVSFFDSTTHPLTDPALNQG